MAAIALAGALLASASAHAHHDTLPDLSGAYCVKMPTHGERNSSNDDYVWMRFEVEYEVRSGGRVYKDTEYFNHHGSSRVDEYRNKEDKYERYDWRGPHVCVRTAEMQRQLNAFIEQEQSVPSGYRFPHDTRAEIKRVRADIYANDRSKCPWMEGQELDWGANVLVGAFPGAYRPFACRKLERGVDSVYQGQKDRLTQEKERGIKFDPGAFYQGDSKVNWKYVLHRALGGDRQNYRWDRIRWIHWMK